MIVECSNCGTKYRVREEKLPAGGGNIKCPSCAFIFFVRPPAPKPETSGGLRPISGGLRKASGGLGGDDLPTRVGTMPSALLGGTNALPRLGSSSEIAAARASELNTTAPRHPALPSMGQPPMMQPPEPAAPELDLSSASWKLKTSIGLVYDFPDTESLRNWLSSREELGGYSLSHDGGQEFKELREYAHIFPESMRQRVMNASADAPAPQTQSGPSPRASRPSPKTAMGMPTANSAGVSGSMPARKRNTSSNNAEAKKAEVKKAGQSARMKAQAKPPQSRPIRPPSRPPPTIRRSATWAIPVSMVLLVVLLVFVLQIAGVIDLRQLVGGGAPPDPTPSPTPSGEVVEAPSDPEVEESPQGAVQPTADPVDDSNNTGSNPLNSADFTNDQLEQARQEIGRREYEKAIQTLKSVEGVAPNNPEVYRMLERAYSRMGDRESARQARDKLKALQAP